jgi:hypothetical protein
MIWLCVFPTLTAINLAFGDWLRTMSPVLPTFVLATVAVPMIAGTLARSWAEFFRRGGGSPEGSCPPRRAMRG